jgi:hypothetical protein
VFRFRALAALAGRLPLGGERELAMTLLISARLADGCTLGDALPVENRKARGTAARQWIGALTLPAAVRAAAQSVADASAGPSRESVAAAMEKLSSQAAHVLDSASRSELKQLSAALRVTS